MDFAAYNLADVYSAPIAMRPFRAAVLVLHFTG